MSLGTSDLTKALIPPPPGVTPNFIDPTHRTGPTIACNVVCLILALVFVGLRLWAKTFITRSIGPDDYTCVAALIFSIGHTACVLAAQNFEVGLDMWNISVYQWQGLFKNYEITHWFLFQYLFFILAIGLVKMSILFLYLRVMPTGQRKSRMSTYAVMAVIVGAIISLELSYIFACKPFSHRWNNAGGSSATCIDVTLHGVINEIINIVTDILIIILPIPMIWSLHLSTRKKVGVILVFATGLLVVAVAAARIAIVEDLLNGDPNVSFKQWEYNITGVIQLYVALICCCLPSLKAFSKRYFPSLHGPNTTFNSKTSGPESKLSNKSSRGRSQVDTIDEIMLENGTRSPDGTYIELKETRDRDETYIMGSGSGLHGHNASSERIVEPWRGKGVANMVSVVGGGGGRNERMDNGRM